MLHANYITAQVGSRPEIVRGDAFEVFGNGECSLYHQKSDERIVVHGDRDSKLHRFPEPREDYRLYCSGKVVVTIFDEVAEPIVPPPPGVGLPVLVLITLFVASAIVSMAILREQRQ